jgi:hypothetical protein
MSDMTEREILDAVDAALDDAARLVGTHGRWSSPHLKSAVVAVEEPASHFEDAKPAKRE